MVFKGQAVVSIFRKTQFCRFFQRGECTRAGLCKFAHAQEELQPAPDFKLTKMCRAMDRTGFCEKGDACTFAHSAEELLTHTRTLPRPGTLAAAAPSSSQRGVAFPPPAPVPLRRSSTDLGAANCIRAFGGTMPLGGEEATDSHGPSSLAALFGASRCKPEEEDDESELDLPGNSWNRRSTDEGPAEPTVEFDGQSSEDWEYVQDAKGAAGGEACAAPPDAFQTAERARQPGLAAVLSHRYVVKKTFIEFDDEDTPRLGIRRVRSTGGELSLAL